MLATEFVQKIKTHILCAVNIFYTFLFENRTVYETIFQATDDNMAHSNYMLDI